MRNYFTHAKFIKLKKRKKSTTPEIREKRKTEIYMQFRVAKRNRTCVCASETGSQLSCVLEAMNAAAAIDTYQRLSRDHSPLNHSPGVRCHYLRVLVINYLTLLALISTSMHSTLID